MFEKLTKAKPYQLMLWMLSAQFFGIGLGVILADYLAIYAIWIALIAAIIHLRMMYVIYSTKE